MTIAYVYLILEDNASNAMGLQVPS